MKTLMRKVVLGAVLAVPTAALAAPCHNVLGAWTFTLACVGRPSPPHFDAQTLHGVVTDQEGCVFLGTLNGFRWVGALAGDGNRTVHSDFGNAKAVGELSRRRDGLFTEMTFTYTYSEFGSPPVTYSTACTGTVTRD